MIFFKPKYLKKEYVWISEYNKTLKEIALLDIEINVLEELVKEGLGNMKVAEKKEQLSPNSFEMENICASDFLKEKTRDRANTERHFKSIKLLLNI